MPDSSAFPDFDWPGFCHNFVSPLAQVDPESGESFPRQTFDPEAHAGYVYLAPGEVASTRRWCQNVAADFDSEGNLLGVEMLGIRGWTGQQESRVSDHLLMDLFSAAAMWLTLMEKIDNDPDRIVESIREALRKSGRL